MKNIFKYKLNYQEEQELSIPLVKILDIQIQNDTPCLWAIVDDDPEKVVTEWLIIYKVTGTNVDVYANDNLKYISTTQVNGFVLHWFYK